jgi:Zn-dependent metalloprotease
VVLRDEWGQVTLAMPAGGPVRLPGVSGDEEGALHFFEQYKAELHVTNARERLTLTSAPASLDGELRSIAFDEHVPGTALPVFHGGILAHFTRDGLLAWVQPSFTANLDKVRRDPQLTPVDAIDRARRELARTMPQFDAMGARVAREPQLGVLEISGTPHLAYRFTLQKDNTAPEAFVDAIDGAVLATNETIHAAFGTAFTARHYLTGPEAREEQRSFVILPWQRRAIDVPQPAMMQPYFPGFTIGIGVYSHSFRFNDRERLEDRIVGDVTSDFWDDTGEPGAGSAVDAYTNMARVAGWFRDTMKRESFDGKGAIVNVVVHNNMGGRAAAFYSASDDTMSFEDGIPGAMLPPAIALDLAAHEFMHGVTRYATGGVPSGLAPEAAAIDEAISDVFAATAEHDLLPGPGNLLIGESILVGRRAFRDLAMPSARDLEQPQVDLYTRESMTTLDGHRTSGIPIKAWFLMTHGGSHNGITIGTGLGWERSRDLWWSVVHSLKTAPAGWTLAAVAHGMIANANSKAAPAPNDGDVVACAWIAVNVLTPTGAKKALGRPPVCPQTVASAAPSGPGCAGHPDGLRCDDTAPSTALVCRNGGIVGTASCADLSQNCKKVAAGDATAVTGPDGEIVCE